MESQAVRVDSPNCGLYNVFTFTADIYRIDSSHKLLGFVCWLNRGGWIGCLGALCFNLVNNMCNTSKRGKGEQCKEGLILGKKEGYCGRLKRWIKKLTFWLWGVWKTREDHFHRGAIRSVRSQKQMYFISRLHCLHITTVNRWFYPTLGEQGGRESPEHTETRTSNDWSVRAGGVDDIKLICNHKTNPVG